jgi:hypothetical protein
MAIVRHDKRLFPYSKATKLIALGGKAYTMDRIVGGTAYIRIMCRVNGFGVSCTFSIRNHCSVYVLIIC